MPEDAVPGFPAERRGSRRQLLGYLLGTSLAGWLGTVLYPVLRYLSPFEEAVNADEVELDDKAKASLAGSGFAIVALGGERVLVFRDPKGRLRATSAKCTHEGCTVRYKADESIIWCACHNGRFDLDGRVLSGPPPRALVAFKASGTPETKVVISRETA
ncbi:MAG: ubiquinol-cytochrome c reductase iron-sulfur subunit [Thermoanaerobaculia bacterium]|nr:MAG: ubiquinol-cytochrome c reductase iron-sulfur subunit [Thermoanaerobaculia bacterium]